MASNWTFLDLEKNRRNPKEMNGNIPCSYQQTSKFDANHNTAICAFFWIRRLFRHYPIVRGGKSLWKSNHLSHVQKLYSFIWSWIVVSLKNIEHRFYSWTLGNNQPVIDWPLHWEKINWLSLLWHSKHLGRNQKFCWHWCWINTVDSGVDSGLRLVRITNLYVREQATCDESQACNPSD